MLLDSRGRNWSVALPETRLERARGLRRGPSPRPLQGMLFTRCRSVHTFGMKVPIQVAFLDSHGWVRSVRAAGPGVLLFDLGARSVFEHGLDSALTPGDRLVQNPPSRR